MNLIQDRGNLLAVKERIENEEFDAALEATDSFMVGVATGEYVEKENNSYPPISGMKTTVELACQSMGKKKVEDKKKYHKTIRNLQNDHAHGAVANTSTAATAAADAAAAGECEEEEIPISSLFSKDAKNESVAAAAAALSLTVCGTNAASARTTLADAIRVKKKARTSVQQDRPMTHSQLRAAKNTALSNEKLTRAALDKAHQTPDKNSLFFCF